MKLLPGGTKKIKPGVSAMSDNPDEVGHSLRELWSFLEATIPTHKHQSTPIFMFATAGLRVVAERNNERIYDDDDSDGDVILDADDDDYRKGPVAQILLNLREHVRDHTPFTLLQPDHIRVLKGEEEGLFDYLTLQQAVKLNRFAHLMGTPAETWQTSVIRPPTAVVSDLEPLCTVDLGGASTQISFQSDVSFTHEIKEFIRAPFAPEYPKIFTHSFLDYGIHRAYDRYLENVLVQVTEDHTSETIDIPCLFQGSNVKVQHGKTLVTLQGSGNSNSCKAQMRNLFVAFKGKCASPPCALSDFQMPPYPTYSNIGGLRVIAFDNAYRVASSHGRKGYVKLRDLMQDVEHSFFLSWEQASIRFEHVPEEERLVLLFESLYLTSLLHYGYGFSKDTYIGFADSVDRQSLSWALGAMVHHAYHLCETSLL